MGSTIKSILMFAIVVLIGSTTVAQEKEFTEEQKKQMAANLEVFSEKLDLSDEQKPKFVTITKKYGKQMMDLKNSDRSRLSKYKVYKSIIENRNKEMKAILSKSQFKNYEEIQQEMQKEMKERNSNRS